MANIVFFMLPETGHINSSLKIAKTLKSRGHQVYYFLIREFEDYIRDQGLEFIPFFEDIFPKGRHFSHNLSTAENMLPCIAAEADARGVDGLILLKSEIRGQLERFEIDLLVQDFNIEINLGLLEIDIPCVMLNSTIISWSVYTTPQIPILTLCPGEFDLPYTKRTAQQHYVEAAIDLQRKEVEFQWDWIREGRRLIYCSLGTQSHWTHSSDSHESSQRTRKNFLQAVIDAMAGRSDWQLILSLGEHLSAQNFDSVPPNVLLVNRVPQIEILKRASLMITHGGLNTIKECILFEVPMIVFPLVGDQLKNADCVVYHQLGLQGNVAKSSARSIQSLIDNICGNPAFRSKLKVMKEIFIKAEEEGRAITLIESALMSRNVLSFPGGRSLSN